MRFSQDAQNLLQEPSQEWTSSKRASSTYKPLHTYDLPKGTDRSYSQQYADMYFTRLALLKDDVDEVAEAAWSNIELAGSQAEPVERVLDVRQGKLCWVVGIVYAEMPLKPNVLDDIAKEHWIAAPPPRMKYLAPDGIPELMLEDASGRLRLTGEILKNQLLITGCVIAALGTENADGAFEVADIKVADFPPQPERTISNGTATDGNGKSVQEDGHASNKVMIVSGLEFDGQSGAVLPHEMLLDYLTGDAEPTQMQPDASRVVRLIVAGNSLANANPILSREEFDDWKSTNKTYGHDAYKYNEEPCEQLDSFLADILPHVPVTLLPGETDPTNVSLPQQPIHPAMLPRCKTFSSGPSQPTSGKFAEPAQFDCVTNPWEGDIDGLRFLGTGGQPITDAFKYVDGDDSLQMMEHVLRWRVCAPTAPDTLWSYPFQDSDPNVIKECPHVYFAGNQPAFETSIIKGPLNLDDEQSQVVRLIAVPSFNDTGVAVLVDTETLEVETVHFETFAKPGESQMQ